MTSKEENKLEETAEEQTPEEKGLNPEDSSDGELVSDKDEKKEERKTDSEDSATDQDSPRGVLEIPVSGTYSDGSSRSIGSETSPVDHRATSSCRKPAKWHRLHWRDMISGLIMRKRSSLPAAATRSLSLSLSFRRHTERITSNKNPLGPALVAAEVAMIGQARLSWRSFDCAELAAATEGFSPENLIGKGGHAEVYKGCLADGQLVAVKRLTKAEDGEERIGDFLSELGIIAHVNHPNAAQLVGFGVEGGLHLVLRFSPHGSLSSVLHGLEEGLDWKVRFDIALGIAEGLLYLHQGCQRRMIHRDIKASNILLSDDFQPQISDFGLAKWLPDKWNHHVVYPIEGTFGYLAPEYFMHGVVNEKTDVFAFGVLLLELITGRKAVDSSRQSLVIWAKPLLEANNLKDLVDPSLKDDYNTEEMARAVQAASMCIHHISVSRPYMDRVVRLLRGEEGRPEPTPKESTLKGMRPPLFHAGDLEEYTRSRYLNDLQRHKQLALEQ